jgi:uncharacterized protein (TIGR00730 family)
MSQQPPKAYKNLEFLNSPSARPIRILCELEETRQRFLKEGVDHTVVFFGSARTRSSEDAASALEMAQAEAKSQPDDAAVAARLKKAEIAVRMSEYYDAARALGRKLTEWNRVQSTGRHYYVTTGGGPGIMEAGNRGAHDAGGRSVGLGISLPFETGVNDYVPPELGFEFHYFFTRKYWFLYLCKAMVIFPGGYGTMDELFETLTLVQTGKIKKKIPIVLFGTAYWSKVMNLQWMAEFGTISPQDLDLIYPTDSVEDAFTFLTSRLEKD